MKAKYALFALFLPIFAVGQKINPDTLSFNYTGVVQADSMSAKSLQSRAKLFVAEAFKSAKDVTQMDDPDGGIIMVKGTMAPVIKAPLLGHIEYGYVSFTIKIQVKDGRYKYTFSDFYHEAHEQNKGSGGSLTNHKPACGTFIMTMGYWRQIKAYTNGQVIEQIAHLQEKMKGGKDEF